MEGGVQVISRETVKPSSQTHHQLKKLKLSYLDQLIANVCVPIIFFFQADESKGLTISNHVQISQKLKQSLSDTLTLFYPLAGRVEVDDNTVVDCNDTGVEFIEARTHAHLMDALKHPDMEGKLKQYLPIDPTNCALGLGERPFFLVQITLFDCGGIALGVCFSHSIADCESIMAFINAWASKCRSEEPNRLVSFDLAKYFPAREFPSSDMWGLVMGNEKFKTKRFVFEKDIIAVLKQKAISSSDSVVKDPTRVELVSAFIWKNFIEMAKFNNPNKSTETFAATHVVNLRGRKNPSQLLENVFGNCVMLSSAIADVGIHEYHDLVSKFRSSLRKFDDDYITESQNGDNYLHDLFGLVSHIFSKGEVNGCFFTSWCRFPLYEVNYGFGSPIWVSTTALTGKNVILLISSKTGDNIEAWINMEQHNLEMLDNQINLLSQDIQSSTP